MTDRAANRVGRSVAFLRSINVGGRRATNQQLASAFVACGLSEIDCFLASGNVLFTPPEGADRSGLVDRIEAGLATTLGFEVPTTIRDSAQLRALAAAMPFAAADLDAATGKPQVMLLFQPPVDSAAVDQALALSDPDDRLVFAADDLFWLPTVGVGRSTLDVAALSAAVGPFTVRTLNTITRLAAKL